MSDNLFDDVLTVAVDGIGVLRGVDEVERGDKCNCICPYCHGKLSAIQGPKKRHHFRHKGGSCEWAIDAAVHMQALQILRENEKIMFPPLKFRDHENCGCLKTIAKGELINISDIREEEISGRRVSEITFHAQPGNRKFSVVLCAAHPITPAQAENIANKRINMIEVDIRRWAHRAIKEQGRHADREGITAEVQTRSLIEGFLLEECGHYKTWRFNAKAFEEENNSVARKTIADEQRAKEREAQQKIKEENARKAEQDRKESERIRRKKDEQKKHEYDQWQKQQDEEEMVRLQKEAEKDFEARQAKFAPAIKKEADVIEMRGHRALLIDRSTVRHFVHDCPKKRDRAYIISDCGVTGIATRHCPHCRGQGRFHLICDYLEE